MMTIIAWIWSLIGFERTGHIEIKDSCLIRLRHYIFCKQLPVFYVFHPYFSFFCVTMYVLFTSLTTTKIYKHRSHFRERVTEKKKRKRYERKGIEKGRCILFSKFSDLISPEIHVPETIDIISCPRVFSFDKSVDAANRDLNQSELYFMHD